MLKLPAYAWELNIQNLHCTKLGLLHQVTHSYLKVNSERELEQAEALGWNNAPMLACFMRFAGAQFWEADSRTRGILTIQP